ncbi:STAS domain-containing protein [Noviherbaspirillum sp. CPCC 100848]|uniref:Anti-sigma factor antagonist n=1 Tax=Noviherbaspirillum album TaxID=3080276 RepID=A0ABU6JAT9_9BURK|nr:STAS domain-containing protein [Noviherbaspirillum sp. CPCC 100848]MEC4720751.1 STAS domain-containing protein [Noviherbaspirillum sp. CPCC 100848]
MSINISQHDNILVISPVGRLDSGTSPELEKTVIQKLEEGNHRIVFDFSMLDYISSAGLRVILLAGKKLRPLGGKMALAGMKPMVHDVFEMSGFLALFAVAPTVDEARSKI